MAIWTLKVTKKCLNQKTRQKKEQLPSKVTALFNTAPTKNYFKDNKMYLFNRRFDLLFYSNNQQNRSVNYNQALLLLHQFQELIHK